MFSLLSRSRSKVNKSDVQLPAKQEPEAPAAPETTTAEAVAPTPETDAVLSVSAPAEIASEQPTVDDARPSASIYSSDERQEVPDDAPTSGSAADVSTAPTSQEAEAEDKATELKAEAAAPLHAPVNARRFSFRPLSFKFMNGQPPADEHAKAILSTEQEHKKRLQASEDRVKRAVRVSSADKKAKESAVIVRSLIVGPAGITLARTKTKPVSKPRVEKVKSQLLKPKTANRVIAQLRALPASTEPLATPHANVDAVTLGPAAPIHAVCLSYTDAEAETRHFSKFKAQSTTVEHTVSVTSATAGAASVYSASITQLREVFEEMELVNLVTAPNLGLGESGDSPGLLSGAVPTAKTIIEGLEQVTPQLMALGYATGKAILPDHTGIHPPTDRMSVLTYWWGFEVCLPPPSIEYLSKAPSIAHSVINVLTALAVLNEGAREILPFVRYISSFIDTEFNMIKREDRGKGVVCAATWLIPVALVPRPWDFTPAPIINIQPAPTEDPSNPTETNPADPRTPPHKPSMELPPSRPASPPTLLPPLTIHEASFGEPEANAAPPVDETPATPVATASVESTGDGATADVPAVAVTPPTPTSIASTDSAGTVTAA